MGWLDTFKDWVFGEEKSPPAPKSSSNWSRLRGVSGSTNVAGTSRQPSKTRASGRINAARPSGNYSGGGDGGSSWGPAPRTTSQPNRGGGGGGSWGGPVAPDTAAPWRDRRPIYGGDKESYQLEDRRRGFSQQPVNPYNFGPNRNNQRFPLRNFNPLRFAPPTQETLLADAGSGLDFNPSTLPPLRGPGGGSGGAVAMGVGMEPRSPLVDDEDRNGPLPNSGYSLDATPTPRPASPGMRRQNVGAEDRMAAVDPTTGAAVAVPVPSGPTRQLLQNRDWTLPDEEPGPPGVSLDLDVGSASPLTEYSYDVDDAQLASIINTYQDAEGFTAPEKVARQPFGPGGRRMPQTKHWENDTRTITATDAQSMRMTQEEYDALSPDQRAAVDFTGQFLKAREADLKAAATGNQEVADDYGSRVEAVFGEGGGTETYAPRTLELLEAVGFKAEGQDFDEFLSLDRLPTANELMAGDFDEVDFETADLGDPEEVRAAVQGVANQVKVDAALIQQAGEFINAALEDEGVWNTSSAVTTALTGELPENVPIGFGNQEIRDWVRGKDDEFGIDEYFQKTYAGLSNPEADWEEVWTTAVDNADMPEQDVQKLLRYIDLRTRKEAQMGLLSDDLRTPEQIRALVGLED